MSSSGTKAGKGILLILTALVLISSAYAESPIINSIEIAPDDDTGTSGIQVNPNPASTKTITITADITDADDDISKVEAATPRGIIALSKISATEYSNTFEMEFYDAAVVYPVEVIAEDSEKNTGNAYADFEYTKLIALDIDSLSLDFLNMSQNQAKIIQGDKNMATQSRPTIQNIGNEIIDVDILGTDLSSGSDLISVDNVNYTFDNIVWNVLDYTSQTENIGLYYGLMQTNEVSFSLFIPQSQASGTYAGDVTLTASQGQGNHAPILHFIKDVSANEGDLITITANADDLDGDILTYLINDARFNQNNNVFTWQTSAGDAGNYTVNTSVSDGNLEDSQEVAILVNVLVDTTPPATITNLISPSKGTTWIYWTWINPGDSDFAENIIFIDDINVANTADNFFNATGFNPNTTHTIKIHAKDNNGNINNTDVTDAQTTDPLPVLPDLSIDFSSVYADNPKAGEWTTFKVVIKNIGDASADNIYWIFITQATPANQTFGPFSLDIGKNVAVYPAVKYASAGTYNPEFTVDYQDLIEEKNETNNQIIIPVTIS